MGQLLEANWPLIVAALVLGLLVAWWIFAVRRRTRVTREDMAAADALPRRNQALIDAAPAAAAAPTVPVPPTPAMLEEAEAPTAGLIDPPPPPPPGPAPASPPASAASDSELARIKGVGPRLVAQLQALGVTRLEQVAAWDDADIARIDAALGRFQGRIVRDDWVGQARLLAAGDEAAFTARYGKL